MKQNDENRSFKPGSLKKWCTTSGFVLVSFIVVIVPGSEMTSLRLEFLLSYLMFSLSSMGEFVEKGHIYRIQFQFYEDV